jgi:glycosyltransferase involved in cell wall biosynthesis
MALQNGARFLGDSIGSILSQDYEPIELIVIESASSDGSFERARELAPRADISSYPATEPGPARNLGLERASGELIAFCDADDVWVPGRITAMVEALRSSPEAGLVFGQLETFKCPQLSEDERARLPAPGGPMAASISGTVMGRREIFDEAGPFADAGLAEFGEWLVRARHTSWTEIRIENLVLRRRLHTASFTFTNPQRHSEYLQAAEGAIRRRRASAADECG